MQTCWLCSKIIKPWHLVRKGIVGGTSGGVFASGIFVGNYIVHMGCGKKYTRFMSPFIILIILASVGGFAMAIASGIIPDEKSSLAYVLMIVGITLMAVSFFVISIIGHYICKSKVRKLDLADEFIDLETKTRIEKQDALLNHELEEFEKKDQDKKE
ncbi:hypothetical protein [Williamsoniiplasma luminosum]|uniref:Uncharacterized protein n=1 Tax=Williamsoniiplasma luminosum TaxID=214888 RepID=A0A2S0NK74_9MOLU|nr:hypothetical protein [Williamsoniiplasma luminosum]AVP49405.1 MAG: hypothetical protein C5T88_02350 [Williamsoniiplasma luminosum]